MKKKFDLLTLMETIIFYCAVFSVVAFVFIFLTAIGGKSLDYYCDKQQITKKGVKNESK